jgi:hypothetical protein
MKLSDLHPKELNHGFIQFDCPLGHPHRLLVPTDKAFVPNAWDRSGQFPDTLTLRPSILAHQGSPTDPDVRADEYERASTCGWHGFITNGEVTNA